MSRKAKKPIVINDKVDISIDKQSITIKGQKGELSLDLDRTIDMKMDNNELSLQLKNSNKRSTTEKLGLYYSLIENMIYGVTKGYEIDLELNGL